MTELNFAQVVAGFNEIRSQHLCRIYHFMRCLVELREEIEMTKYQARKAIRGRLHIQDMCRH